MRYCQIHKINLSILTAVKFSVYSMTPIYVLYKNYRLTDAATIDDRLAVKLLETMKAKIRDSLHPI